MRSLTACLGIVAVSLLVTPVEVSAQRLTIAPQFTIAERDLAPITAHVRVSIAATRERAGDYRVEGTAVGALFLGALGTWVGTEACRNQPTPLVPGGSSSCSGVTVGVVGAVLGGGVGYVIGRLTPKYR